MTTVTVSNQVNGLAKSMIVKPVEDAVTPALSDESSSVDDPRYKIVGGCICEKTNVGKRDEPIYDYRPLCNFTAIITADVEMDDGETTERCVSIIGNLDTGQPLPEITIRASEFESMSWPVSNWGGRVSIEPGRGVKDKLRHAIQSLSMDSMKYRQIYTHTGWRLIDGKRTFLHGGGAIGVEGIQVELPPNLENYVLPPDNDIDAATAMRESLKLLDVGPSRVSYPIWAAIYLGPLSEFITPAFVLWVEGQSGSLKSSFTAVMLNHFGAGFHEYALSADWLGTANSLEKLAFHTKDAPFLIDDFRPAASRIENKQMQDAAGRIIRAAGNRQGRSRLDSGSNFKRTYAPRGVVISTAERGALGLSVNSRLLTVDIEPGDIDTEKLTYSQQQRHIYGYAMVGFIRYLAANWEQTATKLNQSVTDARVSYGNSGQHKRLPNAIAVLFTAFEMAIHYALHIGAIEQDDADRRVSDCYIALQEIADAQSAIVESQDPALRFVTVIVTLLAQRMALIAGKEGVPDIGGELGERLGWWDGESVFLLPAAAYNRVCRHVGQEGESFPLDATTLAKELERKGYLAGRDKNQIQVGRRDVNGKLKRVYILDHERLMSVAESMGLSESDLYVLNGQALESE